MKISNLPFAGVALTAFLAIAGTVSAQTTTVPLVPTSEFYFANDARTTQPVIAIKGEGEALTDKLVKALARDSRAKKETAQLAHIAFSGGRSGLGTELYQRLLVQVGPNDGLYRTVLWNYGWDLYRSGDHAGALTQWEALLKTRNITADWMPVTFAIALWQLDRRDEAVRWYAAGVRTHPGKWRSTDNHKAALPDWNAQELEVLSQVQQAWEANPPQWD